MNELDIINLYNNESNKHLENFNEKITSNLKISTSFDKTENDVEWLDIMEDTIRYLDNILRNPNRFIINEEDIVKVELARRVTVESIKHLSKNTNLIQDIDKKTGDVRPSKILNINKEESFNTYENRFIYSLIKNMQYYINRKKKNITEDCSSSKEFKQFEYNANSKMGKENIDLSLVINSKIDDKKKSIDESGLSIKERIERLELQISDLTCSAVYQNIDKMHISLVTSPIKKTNVILKNVNFQYAVKLWNYMQEHIDDSISKKKGKNDYEDNSITKKMMDESFYLDYLVLNTIDKGGKIKEKNTKELSEALVDNMLEKVINLDSNISKEDLQKLIESKYQIIKYKIVVNESQIEKIFTKYIDKYLDKIERIKM